jgi:hypothetical protein
MMFNSHIRFLGAMVFIFSLFTGIALINKCECFKLFGGILIVSYTLLQLFVGFKKNEDEGENF